MSELWVEVLAYVVPNLIGILTVVGVVVNFLHKNKKLNNEVIHFFDDKVSRMAKMEQYVAICKAKLESIENHMLEKEKK